MTQVARRENSRRTRRRSLSKNLHKGVAASDIQRAQKVGVAKEGADGDVEVHQALPKNSIITDPWDKHLKSMEKASKDLQKLFCKRHKLLGDKRVRENWKEIGKSSLESLRKKNQILGLYVNGEMRYPAFQFDEDGKPYSLMQEVLEAMPKERTDWLRAYWLVSPNEWLDWKTPISAIKSGDAEVVVVAKHAGRLPVG